MSKPDKNHEETRLTFSREHPDHDGGTGTHVDGYRYQAGSNNRDYEKTHSPVTPGYGEKEVGVPVRQSDADNGAAGPPKTISVTVKYKGRPATAEEIAHFRSQGVLPF